MHRAIRRVYPRIIKPIVDRTVALVLLLLLAPLLATIAVIIRWRLGGPVLFRQTRPGLHARPFRLVKFRTMTEARAADGSLLSDAERLTPFGKWLRATSLDELPELWNVLRGDMSFVGPRPLLTEYLELYSPEQSRRHEAKPGLTGWAQVNGRNQVDWESRFALDVWYVDNISPWIDLLTLAKTVGVVLGRSGVSADNHATMPAFEGTARRRPSERKRAA